MNHELSGSSTTREQRFIQPSFQVPVLKEKTVMKKVLLMTLALMMCAGAAMADHIGIYADTDGLSCALTTLVSPPGNNAFYVIHKLNPGATAAQFKITDATAGALFATTQTTPYLALGTWNTDWSLAYGGCIIGQHVLATLNFLWFGQPLTCNQTLSVDPAPTSPVPGAIALVDCANPANLKSASGGRAFAGPGNDQCPAGCGEVATETTTWGSVKALYR
jgi:hypothetical protein